MPIRLRAKINRVTGNTFHGTATLKDGLPSINEELPSPDSVEIVEESGGFFLYRIDSTGSCIADTWHQNVQEAMSQAEYEYIILSTDWYKV